MGSRLECVPQREGGKSECRLCGRAVIWRAGEYTYQLDHSKLLCGRCACGDSTSPGLIHRVIGQRRWLLPLSLLDLEDIAQNAAGHELAERAADARREFVQELRAEFVHRDVEELASVHPHEPTARDESAIAEQQPELG